MERQAKIYQQNELAGYLAEGDEGFTYRYDEKYLNSSNPKVGDELKIKDASVLEKKIKPPVELQLKMRDFFIAANFSFFNSISSICLGVL